MKNFHDALQAIARSAGLPSLDLNADGFAELVIGDGALSIFLFRPEESQLELSTRISALDGPVSDGLAQVLLAENASRTLGRFAIDDGSGVVFGHRVELATATPASLLAELNAFTKDAAHLEQSGAIALSERAEQHRPSQGLPESEMIRL